jgi:hypothetical protein
MSVLDHVGERFGAEEVRARLDRSGEPAVRHIELNGNREPGGEGVNGRGETALREDGGVDPCDNVPQVLDPAPGIAEGEAEQFLGALRRGFPFLLGELEVEDSGDEPLLGAIVQVAGDASACGVGGSDQART